MITYNDIYEAAKKERYTEQLQPISKSFVSEFAEYLKDKKQVASKEEGDFSEVIVRTKKQLENAITLFKELMVRRRKKILNLVLIAAETGISKQDFENMLQIEKELFEELMKNIELADKSLNDLLSGNGNEEGEEKKSKIQKVLFLENVDEFVGLDGNSLGPFKKGDITDLVSNISDILVADGRVRLKEQ
jgi:DNA replication initiation complex subunit (GINS family)